MQKRSRASVLIHAGPPPETTDPRPQRALPPPIAYPAAVGPTPVVLEAIAARSLRLLGVIDELQVSAGEAPPAVLTVRALGSGRPAQQARHRPGNTRAPRRGTASRACSKIPVSSLNRNRCSNDKLGTVTPSPLPLALATPRPAPITLANRGPRQLGRQASGRLNHGPRNFGSGQDAPDRGRKWRSGTRCGTMVPAPDDNSSTACGKAVATTGRRAVTASISTPDVTWSGKS